MKIINSWKSLNKQFDKLEVCLRVSFLTIFELKIDIDSGYFRLVILNLGITL